MTYGSVEVNRISAQHTESGHIGPRTRSGWIQQRAGGLRPHPLTPRALRGPRSLLFEAAGLALEREAERRAESRVLVALVMLTSQTTEALLH